MILIFRYSLPLIVTGLIVGVVLRRLLGRQRLAATLIAVTALPILIHAGIGVATATSLADVGRAAAVFGVLTLLLLIAVLWLGVRMVATRPILAFAVPLVATTVYLLLRYLALVLPLQGQSARLSLIPTLVLLGSVIFVASALLTYAPRLPQLRAPNLLRWFRRR
jgi:hypothetical protein